jgi:hypothetical protein
MGRGLVGALPGPAQDIAGRRIHVLWEIRQRVFRSRSPTLNDMTKTKTKTDRPDVLEIAMMRARWKEERAAGATGETFASWRKRIRAEVIEELGDVLGSDPRRWPDSRKRDLGKPERRKRRRAI